MALLAFNTTTSAIPLIAGGLTLTSVPASPSGGTLGRAWDVTNALRPNATVDPVNGVTGGKSAAELGAIDAAVRAPGSVLFMWTGSPVTTA